MSTIAFSTKSEWDMLYDALRQYIDNGNDDLDPGMVAKLEIAKKILGRMDRELASLAEVTK